MAVRRRDLEPQARRDLSRKMVFVAGPRQVGKTTLARLLLGRQARGYLNWDVPEHREQILRRELPPVPLLVFDELHKYRGWRNWLKGLYDRPGARRRILVTGSARLDFYRFGAAAAWQVSATGEKDYATPEGIRVAPALTLLASLV